jgi:AcrR family transcriptional regulator
MKPSRPDARTRRRKPQRLTRELIVDASIRQLRRVGAEKFSVRALAKDLGVTPMALYRHVPNKRTLIDEVRQSLLALVPLVVEPEAAGARAGQPLSEKDIVEHALRLVREHGLVKLNMRALARQLGVTPMALYRHVSNKEALLSRMTDVLIERLPVPPPSACSWEEDFRTHARLVWQEFSKYPGLVGAFASGPSPKVLEHMRYEHSMFLAAGMDAHSAALAVTVYHTFLLGLFRTQAYLAFLARRDGKNSGVSVEAVRRYDDRLLLAELLSFSLDAIVAGVRALQATERRDPILKE